MPCKSSAPSSWSSLRSTSTSWLIPPPFEVPTSKQMPTAIHHNLVPKKKLRVGETMQDQTLLFLTLPAPWRTCFFSTTWNQASAPFAEPTVSRATASSHDCWKGIVMYYACFFQDSRPSLSNIIPSVHSLNAKCESFTKKSEFPPFQIPILSGNRWKSFECRAPFLRHLQLSCSSTSRIARRLQDLHLICWQFHSLLGLAKKLPKLTGLLGCLLVRIGIKDTNTEIFVLLIHVKFFY